MEMSSREILKRRLLNVTAMWEVFLDRFTLGRGACACSIENPFNLYAFNLFRNTHLINVHLDAMQIFVQGLYTFHT